MKIILDSCTFLWLCTDSCELSSRARELIRDLDNELLLSSVSAWEISIKFGLGKLLLPESPAHFIPSRREKYMIGTLPLSEEEATHSGNLPKLHTDPFDRLLVAQSLLNDAMILTPDRAIGAYGVRVIW